MRRKVLGTYPDLATYLLESGDIQARLAVAVGATQAHISRIAAGELVPRPALAVRIAKYARIPLDSFTRVYLAKRLTGVTTNFGSDV
jgi:transcriptional regulator with XRE-family HTH domain